MSGVVSGAGAGAAGAFTAGESGSGGASASAGSAGFAAAAGSAGTSAGFPLRVPTRRRIAAGNQVTCVAGTASVTCWGVGPAGRGSSFEPLSGAVRDLALGSLAGSQPICGTLHSGTVTCSDWQGGPAPSLTGCLPTAQLQDFALDRYGSGAIAWVTVVGQVQVVSPTTCTARPVPSGIGAAKRVSAGAGHVCVLNGDGAASCWDTGLGTLEPSLTDHFVDIAAGSVEACGVTNTGKVRCWDSTGKEDLGPSNFAQIVSTGADSPPVVQLASDATGHNLCALFNDGRVLCSQEFNLGLARSFQLPPGERVVEIAVGTSHVCGIRSDDSVLCVPLSCSSDCAANITPPAGFHAAAP